MTFTETCWEHTRDIYDAIINHPFNRELGKGTLSKDRFTFYVQQDSLYLRDFTRALAILAAKASTSEEEADLLQYARDGIAVEQALHGMFFKQFEIPQKHLREPACFAYTRFLLASASIESYGIGLAAVLPCFWIYREVGLSIAKHATTPNPYMPWIETYSDETFGNAVTRMLAIINTAAERVGESERTDMLAAYQRSAEYEWMFWDGAYRQEQWPLS